MGMNELIKEYFDALPSGYSLEIEVPKFHRWLLDNHRLTLQSWVATNTNAFLSRAVSVHNREARSKVRRSGLIQAVREKDVSEFHLTCAVGPKNLRIRVGQMKAPDHLEVAERYRDSSDRSRRLGAFHEAVADRIGDRTTDEVMTETEYGLLRAEIVGDPGPRPSLAEILQVGTPDE